MLEHRVPILRRQEGGVRDRVVSATEFEQSVPKSGGILDLLDRGAEEVGPLVLPPAHLEGSLGRSPPGGIRWRLVGEGLLAHDLEAGAG